MAPAPRRCSPFQDLPNHLATITVIRHLDLYPEFVFNGYFKTNSALFTWLLLVGNVVGTKAAARLFAVMVLALGAFAYPRFVLSFGGRRRMVVSAFFAWPMVHNWFVSMGMLDFALSVPLATILLVLLNEQRQGPTHLRALGIGLLAILTWHAPCFSAARRASAHRRRKWRCSERGPTESRKRRRWPFLSCPPAYSSQSRCGIPHDGARGRDDRVRGPGTSLAALGALLQHVGRVVDRLHLVRDCHARALHRDGLVGDVPVARPGAVLRAHFPWPSRPSISSPYVATNGFTSTRGSFRSSGSRPSCGSPIGAASTVLHGARGMRALVHGWHGRRLCSPPARRRLHRGNRRRPRRRSYCPSSSIKGIERDTRSLLHAWGFYVSEKLTSAPLLFAHSRSFPVMYNTPPEPQFNHLVLESFAPSMADMGLRGALGRGRRDGRLRRPPGAVAGPTSGAKPSPDSITCSCGTLRKRFSHCSPGLPRDVPARRAHDSNVAIRRTCRRPHGRRRSSTSTRRPGPAAGGSAKKAFPTSPEKLPPLRAKTSPCSPS